MYRVSPSEADKWVTEAEKKISLNTGIFRFIFGGSRKVEDAIECYKKAGNLYKMDKNWEEAGKCFSKAASLSFDQNNKHQAALDYEQAAKCLKKDNAEEAETCLLKSIEIYLDLGRFTMAAKVHESIGNMYEMEPSQIEKVIQHYEQASEYYKGEESSSSANRCLLKVAHLSAELEKFEKAMVIYEQVAKVSLNSSLLKYSAKDYFFKAIICSLCLDIGSAKANLENYVKIHPAFVDSREFKFCQDLIKAFEDQDVDGFTDVVKKYDSVQFLDRWFTALLVRIKKKLMEEPDLR